MALLMKLFHEVYNSETYIYLPLYVTNQVFHFAITFFIYLLLNQATALAKFCVLPSEIFKR